MTLRLRILFCLVLLGLSGPCISQGIDLDKNGISDLWEILHQGVTLPEVVKNSPDSDGDGLSDWEEAQLSFDPGNPNSARSQAAGGDREQFLRLFSNTAKPSSEKASRFLSQATLGPNDQEIARICKIGLERWIDLELKRPPTPMEPYIEYLGSRRENDLPKSSAKFAYHKVKSAGNNVGYLNSSTAWMRAVLGGDDLLRQRVAWALSQILVATSNKTNIMTEAVCNYYDGLVAHAFGDYEDLLLEVTLHPVMGKYLSHLGNQKAKPNINRYPDENYAREIMQLFSIGLWELQPDGSIKFDEKGEPIATYSNEDIETLARVFTGLWIANVPYGKNSWDSYDEPMVIHETHHDTDEKIALGGQLHLPAGQSGIDDIKQTVHALANHPSTAPFISIRLINHLVTSNPSPEYIKRVVAVWNDTSGNLGAVVKAILLDPEARDSQFLLDPHFGRLKGPVLRCTTIMRAFQAGKKLGTGPSDYPGLQWWDPSPTEGIQQEPMRSPTVFNFFEAVYQKPGAIAEGNLRSPEFQIMNDVTAATVPNYLWEGITKGFHHRPRRPEKPLLCEFTEESQLDIEALLDRCNLMLNAGMMSASTRAQLKEYLETKTDPTERAQLAVFGAAVCPEGAILR